MKIDSNDTRHEVEIRVELADITPDVVRVELYADAINGGEPEHHECKLIRRFPESNNEYIYSTTIPAFRAAADYTARVVSNYGVVVPLEDTHILWQR